MLLADVWSSLTWPQVALITIVLIVLYAVYDARR